jgi:hypothetical protein
MKRAIFFALGVCFGLPHALFAQSASVANREALLQRFVAPKPMSYRVEVMFGPSSFANAADPSVSTPSGVNPTRVLEVRNGLLISSPSVPGAQFAISDQTKSIAALLSNYQAQWEQLAADARLAKRPVQQLKLIPRDGWRYTRVLWLDEQTGVPLKTEIYRKNELIERIQVKNIEFIDAGSTANPGSIRAVDKTDSASEIAKQSMFYVRNVPTGFALTSVFNDAVHVQQIYSDGLARVSIFVQSLGALPAAGYTQRGSTGFVVRRNGNVDLVAVGDVPQATLDRFLSGIDAIQQ